jgi:hypothetical protein
MHEEIRLLLGKLFEKPARPYLVAFSRLYFLIAQATNVLLKCLKTGYIADR